MTECLHRRCLWMVLCSLLLLSVFGCAHQPADKMMVPGSAGPAACVGNVRPSPYGPIVCVDDRDPSLPASPDEIHVVNLPAGRRPTVLNWFTVSGNHLLSISFVDPGCVLHAPDCQGSHCVAVVKPNAAEHTRCRYNITLLDVAGHVKDPVVEIDACCPPP